MESIASIEGASKCQKVHTTLWGKWIVHDRVFARPGPSNVYFFKQRETV